MSTTHLDLLCQKTELDPSILTLLRSSWESNKNGSLEMFRLASALSTSNQVQHQLESIELFKKLVYSSEFGVDSMKNISLTYYSLQNFEKSRYYIGELYRSMPDDPEVKDLYSAIMSKHQEALQDAALKQNVGIGVGVGILALGVGLAFALMGKKN